MKLKIQREVAQAINQAFDESAVEFAELVGLDMAEMAKQYAVCKKPDVFEDNRGILRWYFETESGVKSREYTLEIDFILK